MDEKEIGSRIKTLRERAEISQSAAAAYLGMKDAPYGFLEQGKTSLKCDRLLRLCELFKVTPNHFFYDGSVVSDEDRRAIMEHVGEIIGPAFDTVESLTKLAVGLRSVLKDAGYLKLGLENVGIKDKRSGRQT